MKNINILTQFKQKTKVVIATTIMGIALVSVGGINNINYNSSTNSVDKYTQVFGSVYETQQGVTIGSDLNVRSGAGTNYSILGSMKIGTQISIIGKINNFYKITYGNKTGYVSTQYVKITAKPVVVAKAAVVVPFETQQGVTTGSDLSVRSGAGTNYSILGSMKIGTKISITGKANNFYKVTYGSKTGYVSAQYVKIIAKPVVAAKVAEVVPYETQQGVTTASSLSVRSGAGTNYPILGSIKSGTKISITGKTNKFYKITYNGKTGYISSQYVKIS